MSSVGEAIKFFLNKNWVVFALSLIGGFFATIATPADWRNSIPFENNDWKTIAISLYQPQYSTSFLVALLA